MYPYNHNFFCPCQADDKSHTASGVAGLQNRVSALSEDNRSPVAAEFTQRESMWRPRVSVCMASYNGERYIGKQVRSILPQLGPGDELIISDDGSTDETLAIIGSIADSRIELMHHSKPENPYKGTYRNIYYVYRNVENALSHSTGDYILLADQDDVWLAGKVGQMVAALEAGANAAMHDSRVTDGELRPLMESYFTFVKPSDSLYRWLVKCFWQGASMGFTREVLQRALPFPDIPVSHDHWIAYNARFGNKRFCSNYIERPLMLYRRHEANVSPSGAKSSNPLSFKITYRMHLLRALREAYRR